MKRAMIGLIVAALAFTVVAQADASPVASKAKLCKKKQKFSKKRRKCVKLKPGPQGPAGQNGQSGNPGDPGNPGTPAQTKVTSLNGNPFSASNSSVSLTPDGVNFGPYADSGACDPGGASFGSLVYDGLNGSRLNQVLSLIYTARYTADNDTGGVGVPYLRIFTHGIGDHDAIFSPNTQPDPDTQQGTFHTWVATSGLWRYDDDNGDGQIDGHEPNPAAYGLNGAPYSTLLNDHGEEIVTGIYITTGCSAGLNLQGLLQGWKVNNTDYSFTL